MTTGDDTPGFEPGLGPWPVPQRLQRDLQRHLADLSRLHWLVSQLDRYQPRVSGGAATVAAAVEQAARTRELVAAALVVFEQVEMACEALAEVPGSPPTALVVTTAVVDMAFAARTDLQQVDDRLRRAHAEEPHLATLVTCQQAVRRLRRTLGAVVQSVASCLGQTIPEDPREVESATEVRRAYAAFRRALQQLDSAASMPEGPRLERAWDVLEALLAHEAFGQVRLSDKVVLWRFASRIRSWRGAVESPREAAAIFSDLKATAELLRRINLRESLSRHDIQSLNWLATQLERPALPDDEELRRRAHGLVGLDDELDPVVLRLSEGKREQSDVAVVRMLLKRLTADPTGERP